jgi:hypothetical protein
MIEPGSNSIGVISGRDKLPNYTIKIGAMRLPANTPPLQRQEECAHPRTFLTMRFRTSSNLLWNRIY